MPEKPSVFVSSTIYDFKDLRSAIRYLLTSMGFDVYLSEFNDFPKPLDKNTFHAGLDTLRSSDLFILLIGSRVGSLYDEPQGISITRKEYQIAYDLAKEGKIRLALFVREEIWSLRSDRQALRDYLEHDFLQMKECSQEEVEKLINHPGPAANNPELLFQFLNEVTREEEMRVAQRSGGDLPIANWVHSFSGFQDIADVLRIHLGIRASLGTIALKANIKRELLDNLILTTSKHKGRISTTYGWASFARRHLIGGRDDVSRMPGRYLRWAIMYAITVFKGSNMSTRFIDHGLQSGEFLEYDRDTGSYNYGLFSERLFQLRDRIERYRNSIESLRETLNQFMIKYGEMAKTESDVNVPNKDLIYPLVLADIEQDIHSLSFVLLQALDGDERFLDAVKLNPPTPLIPEADRIRDETVTREEVEDWVKEQFRDIRVITCALHLLQ